MSDQNHANINVAIAGATGLAGESILTLLEEHNFPVGELFLLDDEEGAGKSLPFGGKHYRVRDIQGFDFDGVDICFLAVAEILADVYAPIARDAGAWVIDLCAGVGVEVDPMTTAEDLPPIMSLPHGVTTQVLSLLQPMQGLGKIASIHVFFSEPVSALGREGVAELARQSTHLLNMQPFEPAMLDQQMAFNVLPSDPKLCAAIAAQLVKLVEPSDSAQISVQVSGLLAPVFFGTTVMVHVEFSGAWVDAAEVDWMKRLMHRDDVEWRDDSEPAPTPVSDAANQDRIFVYSSDKQGREATTKQISAVADNVRWGQGMSALHLAWQILKIT